MGVHAFGPIKQVAWLVEDIEPSARRWSRFSGIGPWTIYRNVTLTGQYRGQPTVIVMDVALSYQDELQIELISPRSTTPSPYQDPETGKTLVGMHHVAWMTDDLARDKARGRERGLEIVFEATNAVTNVAYFASADEPGLLLEFMQASPMLLDGFEQGVAASRAWDGVEPILMSIDLGA
jgi:hypothetical protein